MRATPTTFHSRWTGTLVPRTPRSGNPRLSPWSKVLRLPSRLTLLKTLANTLTSSPRIFPLWIRILCNFLWQTNLGFPAIPFSLKLPSTRPFQPRLVLQQTFRPNKFLQTVITACKHLPRPQPNRSVTPKLQFLSTNSHALPLLRLPCPINPLSAASAGKGMPVNVD